jgi:hypothetical protein
MQISLVNVSKSKTIPPTALITMTKNKVTSWPLVHTCTHTHKERKKKKKERRKRNITVQCVSHKPSTPNQLDFLIPPSFTTVVTYTSVVSTPAIAPK